MPITTACTAILTSLTTSKHAHFSTTETLSSTTRALCVESQQNSTITVISTNNSQFVNYGDGLVSMFVAVGIIAVAILLIRGISRIGKD